ncbi:MAG: TIGR00730 family Rossman fold protein [Steroidobacteraceae bacterium]
MTARPVRPARVAYENTDFLTSEAARPLRIIAEYLEPLHRFAQAGVRDTIVFFGSARLTPEGPMGHYYEDARTLARTITQWSMALPTHAHRYVVCSGGGGGIMEAANRGASEAGGKTIGLNISLPHEQVANPYITHELAFEFHYFFMRKLWFAEMARALVAFPGGFGTLDELTEILTLAQTGKLGRRVPVILYGTEYWNEIINFKALLRHGMISAEDLDLFKYVDTPEAALRVLQATLQP